MKLSDIILINNVVIFVYFFITSVFAGKPPADTEKISFFAVEHPFIEYTNPKYITFANMSCRRYSRADPVYYFNLHFKNTIGIGNNVTFHFYFHEFLTNQYKPSFVELHRKGCDLLVKDPIFGAPMKRSLEAVIKPPGTPVCPLPPGDYNMQNCSIFTATIPNFPFLKGRIYANITINSAGERIAGGHVDFQIKEMRIKKGSLG